MKRITNIGAQGDVICRRVKSVPGGYKLSEDRIIAHSETGHNHVAVGECELYRKPNDGMIAYLVARGPVQIEHHRTWDTHETLELYAEDKPEIVWEIRRQREYTPEGWRRVED